MTDEEQAVWNRAALERGGPSPKEGDRALAALLDFHSPAMNGGVLHALGILRDRLSDVAEGYRFFCFDGVARLLEEARNFRPAGPDAEDEWELEVDRRYSDLIPDDSFLFGRFQEHFAAHPELYSPA